jgi:hypothetical protein
MDPMTMAALASLANVGGGILGNILSSGDRDKVREYMEATQRAAAELQAPTLEQIQVNDLPQYQLQGELTPEMIDTINTQSSLMNSIKSDPSLRNAQISALQKLSQMGNEGFTATDRLALEQATRRAAQENKSNQDSIIQNMAQRGQGGGGAELAARLSASQASANRAQEEGLNVAAQAQRRALEAITQASDLGGRMRDQDFSQQSQISRAQDEINRFNATNAQEVARLNVSARNAAQQSNLTNKQNIANLNTDAAQKQRYHNADMYNKAFQNSLNKLKVQDAANNEASNYYQDQADRTARRWSGIGNAVGEGVASAPVVANEWDKYNKKKPTTPNYEDELQKAHNPFKIIR